MRKQSAFTFSAWGVGSCTLLVGEHHGKCFMHAPACAGQCGTGVSEYARWRYPFAAGSLPTKTPGCLHQSRWRSSSFGEHFVHVLYTALVLRAFLSYR